ncbi:hypothetical protein NUH87_12315 [Pseudomonas batumici]|uniref:hypothetical protein n=1 Tax=Pseudomonas batumici TaxID=226910 RepID=UPI0030D5BA32
MASLSNTTNDDPITLRFFTLNNEPIPIPPGLEANYEIAGALAIAGEQITFGSTVYRVAGKYFYYYGDPQYKVYLVRATLSETLSNIPSPADAASANTAKEATQRIFIFRSSEPDCPTYLHKGEDALFAGSTITRLVLQKQFTDFTSSYFNIVFETAF